MDTPVLRPRDYARGIYVIKDIESGMIVSVSKSNLALSRAKTLSESVAVLVPERNSVKPLCVQSRKDWGRIQLSKAETREGENFDRSQADQWLMAGPRGRLEVRSNQSSWESFTIEFVRQSFTVTIAGLLKSPLYDIASEATRSNIRMEIAAKVGKRDVLVGATQQIPKQKKKGGMDYSAALAGLADPPNVTKDDSKTTPHTKTAPNREKISTLKASSNAGVQATAASAVGTASASSALPRNQANRKAAKRKKKKQKAKNAKRNAAANVRKVNDASVMSASKGESVSASSLGSKGGGSDEGKSPVEQEVHSSSKENSRSGAGPPCAACGRGIEGTYTTALGKNFHPHCFCCGKCRRPMGAGAGQFRERGGVPYCQTCYAAHLASRCARCSQPIMDTVITAMEKTWHKECLTCTICRLPLTQTFWLYADKPNEPRCSRCVTGSEEYSGPRGRSGRMVNLPMFNRNNQQTLPVVGPTGGNGSSASGGRARLMNPVLPATTRR